MPDRYSQEYNSYMGEVQGYLSKVRNGRRVPKQDPQAAKFSESADTERQARRMGLAEHIPNGLSFNDKGFGQAFRGEGRTPGYGFSNSYQPSQQSQAIATIIQSLFRGNNTP